MNPSIVKIALLPQILAAAELLHKHGLIEKDAPAIVRAFVCANPDINDALNNRFNEIAASDAAGVKK